ncbi:hypothetical protein P4O66_022817 [Electrophorus voltai]|uniref:Uncharacterized protein n=1 Tax=Electrophorus voltai TaxID=2609070 RepID=A0AAD8ZKM1_9TELE|nr:hypothetical protein P4O66_022817 [Electrophorus voltai]
MMIVKGKRIQMDPCVCHTHHVKLWD